jgi:uncharacterized membrane protein YuzA (DUF378 family)
MNSLILLGALVVLPIIAAFILRVNAILLFFSIMAGGLLTKFLGDDATLALGAFVRGEAASMYSQLILLLLPVVVTLFFGRKSLTASKILFNIPAIILNGLVIGVLALPLLSNGLEKQLVGTEPGSMLRNMQDIIVGLAVLLNLLLLWVTFRHKSEGKHKKHH